MNVKIEDYRVLICPKCGCLGKRQSELWVGYTHIVNIVTCILCGHKERHEYKKVEAQDG